MSSSSTHLPTPEGPGSVSGAPNLPEGFTDTFTSRYVNAGGLRQHAVIGGDGPPLLLVHGWPENWYAWRLLMPELARDFQVIAVDQRGIGLTDKTRDGYDTGTLADDLVALMDALGHERFAVVGHDTGYFISYALAADHPDRVARLVVAEVPGGEPLAAPVRSPRADQQQALAPRLQPGQRRDDRTARQGTRGHLLRLRVRHPGRPEGAARRCPQVLLRPLLRPRRPARQFRVVPGVGHHPRTERGAQEPAAYDVRPGDRRSGKLGRRGRERDKARRGRRADRGHLQRWPLGRRAGPRGDAGGADGVPGPVPGRRLVPGRTRPYSPSCREGSFLETRMR